MPLELRWRANDDGLFSVCGHGNWSEHAKVPTSALWTQHVLERFLTWSRAQPCTACKGMGFKAYSCPHCQHDTTPTGSANTMRPAQKASRDSEGHSAQGGKGGRGGIGIGTA